MCVSSPDGERVVEGTLLRAHIYQITQLIWEFVDGLLYYLNI